MFFIIKVQDFTLEFLDARLWCGWLPECVEYAGCRPAPVLLDDTQRSSHVFYGIALLRYRPYAAGLQA